MSRTDVETPSVNDSWQRTPYADALDVRFSVSWFGSVTGEVFRFGARRWFTTQVIRVSHWTIGYNPPRYSYSRGHFSFRFGDFEVRTWKVLT